MWIVKNPEFYDVIVTTNMFGDIITDLSGIIQGGMGVAAGGNINPEGVSMFEPMGGSAPKYTGTGKINPIAAINAVSMMLDQLGEAKSAKKVMDAIQKVTGTKMKSQAAGKMGYTTTQIGDLVCECYAHNMTFESKSMGEIIVNEDQASAIGGRSTRFLRRVRLEVSIPKQFTAAGDELVSSTGTSIEEFLAIAQRFTTVLQLLWTYAHGVGEVAERTSLTNFASIAVLLKDVKEREARATLMRRQSQTSLSASRLDSLTVTTRK